MVAAAIHVMEGQPMNGEVVRRTSTATLNAALHSLERSWHLSLDAQPNDPVRGRRQVTPESTTAVSALRLLIDELSMRSLHVRKPPPRSQLP